MTTTDENLRRVLLDVKAIGEAYRRGIIHINPAAAGSQVEEARTMLEGMAAFAAELPDGGGKGREHGDSPE